MSTDNIRQLLGRSRYKLSTDKDFNYSIELESKSKLLQPSDIVSTINLNDLLFDERNESTNYRLLGRVRVLTTNALSGNTGSPTSEDWSVEDKWDIKTQTPRYSDKNFSINSGGHISPAFMGVQITSMSGATIGSDRIVTLIKTPQKHNLIVGSFIYITIRQGGIAYQGVQEVTRVEGDNTFIIDKLFISNSIGNFVRVAAPSTKDISLIDLTDVSQAAPSNELGLGGSTTHTVFRVPTVHDLSVGDYVEVRTNQINNPLNGIHIVTSAPSTTQFVLDVKSNLTSNTSVNYEYRFNDGVPSNYFVRTSKLVNDSYDSHKLGFSSSIFGSSFFTDSVADEVYMFENIGDVDVKEEFDFLGRPISEMYITFTKNSDTVFGDSNPTWFSNRFDPQPMDVPSSGYSVIDFYEYNRLSLEEFVCDEVVDHFQPIGSSELYYHKPHHKIKTRVYSNTVEEAAPTENVVGIPDYAETFNNGITIWRDLLSIGIFQEGNNGVDYPFGNKSHYIFQNYDLYIRRQYPDALVFDEISKDINIVC